SHRAMKSNNSFIIDLFPEFFCNPVDITRRNDPFHITNLTRYSNHVVNIFPLSQESAQRYAVNLQYGISSMESRRDGLYQLCSHHTQIPGKRRDEKCESEFRHG